MIIGLTSHNPTRWNLDEDVTESTHTWCQDSWSGDKWIGGVRRHFPAQIFPSDFHEDKKTLVMQRLSDGDTVSITLEKDRSVTRYINKQEMKCVFTDLPQKPLWVVIAMSVKKISLIQTGK